MTEYPIKNISLFSAFIIAICGMIYSLHWISQFNLLPNDCVNKEILSKQNPENDFVAVYYKRSCDSITSYEPVVALRWGESGEYNNIFIPSVISPLELEWVGKHSLKVITPAKSWSLQVVEMSGVDIQYIDYYYPHEHL